MNARLLAKLLRPRGAPKPKPHPSFVSSMVECFDYMEPTRSSEMKPSERLRHRRDLRRMLRTLLASAAMVAACVAALIHFAH